MQVPAFFASYRDDSIVATDGRFSGVRAVAGSRTMPFEQAVSEGIIKESRAPAVVVDCDSLTMGAFIEHIPKNMKVRGADLWFMTFIQDVDDVFDSFTTNADTLLAPYHTVLSDAEFRDMHNVSDSVIPTVFVRRGYGIVNRRRKDTVETILSHLSDLGFYKTCVLDTDGSIPDYEWADIYDGFPAAIPFTDSPDAKAQGFQMTIEPFIF